MNLKPGCRPKHGVCARFAPSAVRWQELGLGRRGGGGGQGQPQRTRVLCGLPEDYQQTMTTGFTCARDRRARRCARCLNSTGFLFWWLHRDVGAKAGEGRWRVREGRTKWPLTALGTCYRERKVEVGQGPELGRRCCVGLWLYRISFTAVQVRICGHTAGCC